MAPDFILASASETRKGLLEAAQIPFRAESSRVDESLIKNAMAGADPATIALALADAKALAVSNRFPQSLVLGADQTLNLSGRLFDKPGSDAEIASQLFNLRGLTHRLETAVSLASNGEVIWRCQRHATLTMRQLSDSFLARYIAENGANLVSSAGGYQMEGAGVQLFSAVEGNHFVILGLPLIELCDALRYHGVLPQ